MNFDALVQSISNIHQRSHASAAKAINTALTLRNWLIGAHIHEYELNGQDRADYGEQLIDKLAEALLSSGVPGCTRVRLYFFLTFYRTYPQIQETLSPESLPWNDKNSLPPILRSLTGKSSEPTDAQIVLTPSEQFHLSGKLLVARLSTSHFELLSAMVDPLKRAFYEIECIKGNWSVRELKRQIGSLYFERSGLSKDKEKLARLANEHAEQTEPRHVIRDPYDGKSQIPKSQITNKSQIPNHKFQKQALAGMDNRLFVSKYQLELPRVEVLQRYLNEQRKHLETEAATA